VSRVPRPRHFSALPPPPPCSCHHSHTAPAAATSPYHRLRPVPSGTRAARRRRCAPSPPPRSTRVQPPPPPEARALRPCPRYSLCRHRRRCPRSCLRPPQQRAATASPCPRASSTPRYARCRRRRSWCVPRVFPPPARPPPLPPSRLPRLLQSDDRVGIGHRHLPRHQVRALLTIVCRALPTARGRPRALILISSSPPPGTEACQVSI
jgi:hypothetical protein